ncbi:MAG: C69 family dipeptidase [Bacteroidales bacterium]|nr:C69 family dipeptidase [Bacteroidales bacterium]
MDCFSILVGRDASADGSVLFAHNEDDYGERVVNIYKVPVLEHGQGASVRLKEGGTLEQAPVTCSFLWLEMPEMDFSDGYMNQYGVTIASDACQSREDNPEFTDGGIGYWLRRIMAERARNAREAVDICGELVEYFGYTGSGRTYCVADPCEAWMVAVVKGKHWVAQRVPENQVAIIPNYYTISDVHLDDTLNFLGSGDLILYAEQRGWYDPAQGAFSFREAYSSPGALTHTENITRHWSAMTLLSGKEYQTGDTFPFSFIPPGKIGLPDLFGVLRDHYEGTELDLTGSYEKGNPHEHGARTICAHTTQYGFVAQLRNGMDPAVGAVLWLAPHRPCVHPFVPWYAGLQEIPEGFARGTYLTALEEHFIPVGDMKDYLPVHMFIKYTAHAREIDEAYLERIYPIREMIVEAERDFMERQILLEQEVREMTDPDQEEIGNMLLGFTLECLLRSQEMMEQ